MSIIELILFSYLAAAVSYTVILSLAGKLSSPRKFPESTKFNSIAVLVPCYKEDSVILSVAEKLSRLEYPKEKFDIVVIADSLQSETLTILAKLPVITIKVEFEKSTKTKSLNAAIDKLKRQYDIAVVNDADNIPQTDFLKKINNAYNAGHHVIQAQRVAKNLNTPFAILDAASEIINNHLFRKGANALGLSSSIIGSGMAYPFNLLKEELSSVNAVGGFDKVLQLNVIERGNKILYLEGTLIFDEKIESAQAFQNQRKRWLSSQLIYWKKFFRKGMRMFFKGNFDYFNLAVVYNLFPPRIFLLASLGLTATLFTLIHWFNGTEVIKWWILLVVYIVSLSIALPSKFFNRQFFIALTKLPFAALQMILILFKLKGADKKFIHTTHTRVEVDNPIYTSDVK
jgi:cellulose synthase/poly-beta-1,6-N-acetylglucosamine synthase-like glycosyltransferase